LHRISLHDVVVVLGGLVVVVGMPWRCEKWGPAAFSGADPGPVLARVDPLLVRRPSR
jgi:hypothetical protein